MSERKNIKRNKTRKGVDQKPFYQSIQRNYTPKKPVNPNQAKLI